MWFDRGHGKAAVVRQNRWNLLHPDAGSTDGRGGTRTHTPRTGQGIFLPRRLSPPRERVRGLDYTLAVGAHRRPLPSSLYTFPPPAAFVWALPVSGTGLARCHL